MSAVLKSEAIRPAFAPQISGLARPALDPYARVLGWRELAAKTREVATKNGAKAVLTDMRETTAELIYYLRDANLPVVVWYRGGPPQNHFEMTRPLSRATPQPLLYVTLLKGETSVLKRFDSVGKIATTTDQGSSVREAHFFLLSGYEPDR